MMENLTQSQMNDNFNQETLATDNMVENRPRLEKNSYYLTEKNSQVTIKCWCRYHWTFNTIARYPN